jgi:hypothetical protein
MGKKHILLIITSNINYLSAVLNGNTTSLRF